MATITTINANDAISDSRSDINTNFANLNSDKIETSYLDTDTTLAANSDSKIPTQKAVKAYVDVGGNVNASETARGIVEEATDAEVAAGTATGGTTAKLFVTPAKLITREITYWKQLGETTLGSANAVISVASFSGRKDLMISFDMPTATANPGNLKITFNSDTGSNYAYSTSFRRGALADATAQANISFRLNGSYSNTNRSSGFIQIFGNIATSTKQVYILNNVVADVATNAPIFEECFGTWTNTAAQITTITITTTSSTFAAGTRLTVYGKGD